MVNRNLMEEPWVSLKNQILDSTQVDLSSIKGTAVVEWFGRECNHSWQRKLSDAVVSNKCPYCANKKVLSGFNDLATTHPKIAGEWHPTKNTILPNQISKASNKKVWWLGECGHEWETTIDKRTRRGTGCPVCVNQKIVPGVNDLATLNPDLASEWHPTKNNILISQISLGSSRKVWWVCDKGHEWQTTVSKRNFSKRGCPVCVNQKIVPGVNDLATSHAELVAEWDDNNNNISPSAVTYGSGKKVRWVCGKGHEWETAVKERMRFGCPKCPTTSSAAEKEITSFLETLGLYVENNVRSTIPHKELDIWVPEKKFAIEFNGLYWHSEAAGKTKNYHYDKWLACKKQGIQLIQIWEDDWNRNPDLIKRMLTHKLGVVSESKVYARETVLVSLSPLEANTFLRLNHVQGCVNGGVRVGLVCVVGGIEELVAVMVLKQEPGSQGKTLNLLRFATSQPVVGGFTKLLTHVEKTFSPTQIVTFSDNTVSNGGLYENTGFKKERELPPDYMYVAKGKREHKFKYRLKKFKKDDGLQFIEGLTEKELAQLNNLPRIWDAGKVKWVKSLTTEKILEVV